MFSTTHIHYAITGEEKRLFPKQCYLSAGKQVVPIGTPYKGQVSAWANRNGHYLARELLR
jgi:hypothetical protein